jgi:hypothetical protein
MRGVWCTRVDGGQSIKVARVCEFRHRSKQQTSSKYWYHAFTMKFLSLASMLVGLSSVTSTLAAQSFSASNLYYAAGLTDAQSTTLLGGLQSAGVKVLRVWLDGTHPFQTSLTLR